MSEKLIRLSGFGWKAEISPKYGMNTVRLTVNGRPVLRAPESLKLISGGTAAYGNAVLLPPNRTADGKFTFRGKRYCLPLTEPRYHNNIHGRLHRVSFRVLEKTARRVTASYRNLGEVFPFPFLLTVSFFLDETGYHQSFAFENTGREEMPLPFGLHTNFAAPELFQVPLGCKWPTNDRFLPNGEPEALGEKDLAFRSGSPSQGFPISGFYTSGGATARLDDVLYTVSDNFNQWLLWNGEGNKGFLSLSPLCGAVNSLNSGAGLLTLFPGETETFHTHFHLADA